jgi:GGDEF domain-containing protein
MENSALSALAYLDQATGLSNNRACKERLLNPDPIADNILLTCFMFDLNNLKPTNDKFGHEAGDKLIAGFAGALKTGGTGAYFYRSLRAAMNLWLWVPAWMPWRAGNFYKV